MYPEELFVIVPAVICCLNYLFSYNHLPFLKISSIFYLLDVIFEIKKFIRRFKEIVEELLETRAALARSVAEAAVCAANVTELLDDATRAANYTFSVELSVYAGAGAAGAIELSRVLWLKTKPEAVFPLDRCVCIVCTVFVLIGIYLNCIFFANTLLIGTVY